MFSFFKKKAPAAAPAAEPERAAADASTALPSTSPTVSAPTAMERPRGKLDWLNADVGELFFGKKPESPPDMPPVPIDPPIQASAPSAGEPGKETGDRSG